MRCATCASQDGAVVEIGEHLQPASGEQRLRCNRRRRCARLHRHARASARAGVSAERDDCDRNPGGRSRRIHRRCMHAKYAARAGCARSTRAARKYRGARRALPRLPGRRDHARARRGAEPSILQHSRDAGAVAFSDDGNTVASARVLRDAALQARNVAGVFISHAEDERLKGDAVMSSGCGGRCPRCRRVRPA